MAAPALGSRSGAAMPPGFLIGANVDMGELLSSSSAFIKTSQGDLFDIAHSAGLNVLRVTAYETWGPQQMDRPYTAADWRAIGQRAAATHIQLIPVLELSQDQRRQLSNEQYVPATDSQYASWLFSQADLILGVAGLANLGVVAMMDIENERPLTPRTLAVYRTVTARLHQVYPHIPDTVGGWRVDLHRSSTDRGFAPVPNSSYAFNYPDDGSPLRDIADVIAVHIYGSALPDHRSEEFYRKSPDAISDGTLRYLQRIHAWSGTKRIVVEEFGAPNGVLPYAGAVASSPSTPESQAIEIGAVLRGILRARQQGIPVSGALAWILAPRGTPTLDMAANSFSLIIPRGPGWPLRILPGLQELCNALNGLVPCPTTAALLQAAIQYAPN